MHRDLAGLDESLIQLMQTMQSTAYRKKLLAGFGGAVSMGTIRVLRAVERSGPRASVTDVAEALLLSHSATSRLVDDAVRAGHLTSERVADDRRRAVIALTPAGQELLDATDASRRLVLAEALRDWSDEDIHTAAALLARLVRDLGRNDECE